MFDSSAAPDPSAESAATGCAIATGCSPQQFWLGVLALAAAVFATYFPSLKGGFIFDDDIMLTDNPLIEAQDGLARFWYTANQPDYVPLTSSTLWLEWRLWHQNATGYRVVNLALHAAACALLWLLLNRLRIPGAFLAALLYAVHPVNVESVAWVEQRKDTLSMVLFLLSIFWYVRNDEERTIGKWYWASLLAFLLAMFSKGSVAVLPLVLVLIAWWQRGRVGWRDLLRAAPFFLVAAVMTPVILWFVTRNTGQSIRDASFVERLVGAGAIVWFYLAKALVPIKLVFIYPLWEILTGNWLWWVPLVAAVSVTALLVARFRAARVGTGRAVLFAWAFFCIALLPVLGFTDPGYVQYSLVADHYQHIALLSGVSLIAAAWSWWHTRAHAAARSAATLLAVLLVGALGWLTLQQNRLYGDAVLLYEATLAENPQSWMAHTNLGISLLGTGRVEEAIFHFSKALQIKPNMAQSHHDLANAFMAANRPLEAMQHYERALELRPDYGKTHTQLGSALLISGRLPEAIEHFRQAAQLEPENAAVHFSLANALSNAGQIPEAIDQYRLAIDRKPNYAEAYNNLGNLLLRTGRPQEAIEQLQLALQYKPDYVEAHNNLGVALAGSGQPVIAIEQFAAALRLDPNNVGTHLNLGAACIKAGKLAEAIEQFKAVLGLQPNDLATYAKLAKAYAQNQQAAEAIATAEKAVELARAGGDAELAAQIGEWLTKYRAQQSSAPTK